MCLSVALAACHNDNHDDTARYQTLVEKAPAGEAFYLPPTPLPGENGDIIWAEEIDAVTGGRVWKILYRSETLRGEAIAVSGWLAIPDKKAGAGGHRIMTYGHGSTGMADACAPTIATDPVSAVILLEEFLAKGYVVAASDYEGLGTPGIHPYVNGTSEAHSLLDAARAARNFVETRNEVVIYGNSQGGHAALFANELVNSYAPELNIVGTIGTSTGISDSTGAFLDFLMDSDFKGFIVMAGLSHNIAYGDEESPLTRWFTPEGIAATEILDIVCVGEVVSTFATYTKEELFVEGAPLPLTTDLYNTDADSLPGQRAGSSPLLMLHGRTDSIILPFLVKPWVESSCDKGQVIDLQWFDTGHGLPYEAPAATIHAIFSWLDNIHAGGEPANICGAVPAP